MLHHPLKQLNKAVVTALTVGAVLVSTSCAFSQISAQLTASKAQVAAFLGTTPTALKAKMVFVNAGYLFLIDYSQATPTITKMTNTQGAIVPMISPDGNYAVYSKGPTSEGGGRSTPSSAYVTALLASATPKVAAVDSAYQPRFMYNSNTMTVIYASKDGANAGWNGLGKTYKTEVPGGVPSNVQTVLYSGGSYLGGLSWDHKYLCSGQDRAVMKNITDNSTAAADTLHQLKFRKTSSGVDTTYQIQVCNPSVSPSSVFTNVMMYIDFGKPSGYTHPLMSAWEFHTRVFISNTRNEILKYWDVPPSVAAMVNSKGLDGSVSKVQLFNPEWSNHPYYGVSAIYFDRWYGDAGIPRDYLKNEKIFLFNIKDSTSIELVNTTDTSLTSTTNMTWPWFWTEIPTGFTESATWLSTAKIPNQTAVVTPMHSRTAFSAIRFDNNTIIAEKALSSVTVYSLNGTMVKNIRPESKRVTLSELAPKSNGMFTIVARDKAGNTETFQWSKIDR